MDRSDASMEAFLSLVRNPLKFRIFLFRKLPAALFSGVRVESIFPDKSVVSLPYKWFTQNPFRSTYFACLSMAAEMSTGLLAMAHIYQRRPRVSMLVTAIEGSFHKKATGRTRFICNDGLALQQAAEQAISTGQAQSFTALSSGYNEARELVAEFRVTWSFKAREISDF